MRGMDKLRRGERVRSTVGQRDDEGTVSPPFKQELTHAPSRVVCLLFSFPIRVVLRPSRHTVSVPNRFWSVGPKIALPLFDGGQRSAEVDRNEALYDQTVAKYRQTVLDGFREVENYLVQLKVLEDEAVVQQQALESARESLRLTSNQYKAGLIAYLDVVVVQATALSAERTVLNLQQSRLIASVNLITALGGGWDGNTDLSANEKAAQ